MNTKQKWQSLIPQYRQLVEQYHINDSSWRQYTTPFWEQQCDRIFQLIYPNPPFNFLSLPEIQHTMFVNAWGKWADVQLEKIKTKNEIKFEKEPNVGMPIKNPEYGFSHNDLHHTYHWWYYLNYTNPSLQYKMYYHFIELGGGYGNMARKLYNGGWCDKYTIIDLPIFCALQWLYLKCTIQGSNEIFFDDKCLFGGNIGIEILPINRVSDTKWNCDLFMSLWSLSEANQKTLDLVTNANWFGANNLFLSFQNKSSDMPHAEQLGFLATECGYNVEIEETEYIPNNYYLIGFSQNNGKNNTHT